MPILGQSLYLVGQSASETDRTIVDLILKTVSYFRLNEIESKMPSFTVKSLMQIPDLPTWLLRGLDR